MLPPKHCNINLTGPIPRWDEAIPLGNGILGSLFWGPMEHLRISVDIAGLWLRRRPEEKLDKEFTYAKLVELARKGDVAETRRIFDTPYARPTPTKIPAGHLFLDGLPRGSYQASLDLGTAVASFSQSGRTILRACLCMGRPVGVLMLPEAYRDAELTVERPSFGNGTQAAEAGNSVSPGSLQQLALPDANLETEDGMIGFSQKVDDRTAYSLLCKKCGATLYYTAVQAESVEKASRLAKLELCAAEDMGAEKLLQQHADIKACLNATDWCRADYEYFRGGGYSSHFRCKAEMPVTMLRFNIVEGIGPVLQIAEGWTADLPDEIHNTIDKRTDPTWPTTWFCPRLTGQGAFTDVYSVMANWGANHGVTVYGHVGADLITLASMLRIPVTMHNVPAEKVYRPHAWASFGTQDQQAADYAACKQYGPLYR